MAVLYLFGSSWEGRVMVGEYPHDMGTHNMDVWGRCPLPSTEPEIGNFIIGRGLNNRYCIGGCLRPLRDASILSLSLRWRAPMTSSTKLFAALPPLKRPAGRFNKKKTKFSKSCYSVLIAQTNGVSVCVLVYPIVRIQRIVRILDGRVAPQHVRETHGVATTIKGLAFKGCFFDGVGFGLATRYNKKNVAQLLSRLTRKFVSCGFMHEPKHYQVPDDSIGLVTFLQKSQPRYDIEFARMTPKTRRWNT